MNFNIPYKKLFYWHKCGISKFGLCFSNKLNKKQFFLKVKDYERRRQFENFLNKRFADRFIHNHSEFFPGKFYDSLYLQEEFEKYRKEV